jgi:hypothetical protein
VAQGVLSKIFNSLFGKKPQELPQEQDLTPTFTELGDKFEVFKKTDILDIHGQRISKDGTKIVAKDDKDTETKSRESTPQEFVKNMIDKAKERSWELYEADTSIPAEKKLKDTPANRVKIFKQTPCLISCTSWAREKYPQEIMKLLKHAVLEYNNIEVEILSQEREAQIAQYAVGYITDHAGIQGVDASNTIVAEGGRGSSQSHALFKKQNHEHSGAWAEKQLKDGLSLDQIKTLFKDDLMKDMREQGTEKLPEGTRNCALMGIYGTALTKDMDVVSKLNLSQDEKKLWAAGKMVLPLQRIKVALEDTIRERDGAEQIRDAKGKTPQQNGVPATLTLAFLEALESIGGRDLNILNAGDKVSITVGQENQKMKPTPCVGAVFEFLNKQKNVDMALLKPSKWTWLTGLDWTKDQAIRVKNK